MDVPLEENLRRALEARAPLAADPQTTAYRLFHGYSEGCPGLVIDRFGDVVIMEDRGAGEESVEAARAFLAESGEIQTVVLKGRGVEPKAVVGTLPSEATVVLEEGLSYQVEPWAPRNPGLYLDARPARTWLRQHSEGRRILNLYSFAGSLGVAAMAGQARGVTHVDTQKRALARCQENHRLNGQRSDARDLERMEVRKMLRKAASKGRTFDGIIVDPPPPDRSPTSRRDVETPISLAPLLAKVAAPNAWILCFFHHDSRSWDELEAAMGKALERSWESVWRGRSGIDFPEDTPEKDLRLSALCLRP